MREGRFHLCAGNVRQHANLFHGCVAEIDYCVLYAHSFRSSKRRGDSMPSHVQITERQLAYAGVSSVIGLRSMHAVKQLLGQFFSC